MMEFFLIDHSGKQLGDAIQLQPTEAQPLLIHIGKRKDRFTVDGSGVVACKVARAQYKVEATPAEVKPFGDEKTLLSDWIAPSQNVTYRRVIAPDVAKNLAGDVAVGFTIHRHALPPKKEKAKA